MHLVRILAIALVMAVTLVAPGRAATLLRDPDIEHALRQVAQPILKAAGLSTNRLQILVVDDRRFNAFVVDHNHIFIHSGLLLKMRTDAMLQAVLAHEAAHITNGHLARRPINLRNARTAAGIGAALAAAAAAATGRGELAGIGAAGASTTAQRLFFVHTRSEENAADQTAMRYLAAAGADPQGMIEVMDIFRGQELLSASRQDPYARTHPLSSDRFRVVKRLAESFAGKTKENASTQYWFLRAKAKLSAFQRAPKWTLNRAGETGFEDVKEMRLAIAYHRQSDMSRAVAAIDRALAIRPEDPFYFELKGQILLESRQFQAAAKAYGEAARIDPKNPLTLGSYGRALLAVGRTEEAVQYLGEAHSRDGRDPRVLRDLAQAHASRGNQGMASLATAERYAMQGRLSDAGIHARRASDLLPRGSTGWRRAQDVLAASERAAKKKKKKR